MGICNQFSAICNICTRTLCFIFLVSFIQTRTLAHRCLYVCMCVSLYVYTGSRMHFTEAHVPHNFLCSHSCALTLTLTLFLLSPLFVALLVVYEYRKSLASVCVPCRQFVPAQFLFLLSLTYYTANINRVVNVNTVIK